MATTAKKVSIKPLGDRVLVLPTPKDEVTLSGIIIPDSAKQEALSKGTVVAAGPGRYDNGKLVPMTVKAGDTILFSKYGFDEVKVDGQEYYILSESAVLAVLA
jgi:chaperonin GroES